MDTELCHEPNCTKDAYQWCRDCCKVICEDCYNKHDGLCSQCWFANRMECER